MTPMWITQPCIPLLGKPIGKIPTSLEGLDKMEERGGAGGGK